MAYFKNGTKDIVLGVDIPTWVIDYEENENHIATLTKDEAILGAHLMWSVVKSSGPDAFDTIKPEYSRDSSFGKILVDLVKITGMNSPNEYDDTVRRVRNIMHMTMGSGAVAAMCLPKPSDLDGMCGAIAVPTTPCIGYWPNSISFEFDQEGKLEFYKGNGKCKTLWVDAKDWIKITPVETPKKHKLIGRTIDKHEIDNKLPLVNIKSKITKICMDNELQLTPSELNVYTNHVVTHGYFKFNKKHLTVIKNREKKDEQ